MAARPTLLVGAGAGSADGGVIARFDDFDSNNFGTAMVRDFRSQRRVNRNGNILRGGNTIPKGSVFVQESPCKTRFYTLVENLIE